MCDIWFTKYHNSRPGGYAQFMPVQATDDGLAETVTKRDRFFIIKLPGVSKNHPVIQKFFDEVLDDVDPDKIVSRRRWILRGNDLPLNARRKFQEKGYVTIKAGNYSGDFDYTWNQVKNFFRDNVRGEDGGGDI